MAPATLDEGGIVSAYQREPDGSRRKAMPIPRYGLLSMACPECGRVFYGFTTNSQIGKYEAHWKRTHDRSHPKTWGGVIT